MDDAGVRRNSIVRLWNWFWSPARSVSLGVLLILGGGGGVMLWGGFNWAMEISNTDTFCTSCHEMRDFVLPELKRTVRY